MKKSINKESILDAALEIIHQSGLGQLTMRKIATKLQVKAPALYWYIKNKQELLQLLAEYISAQIVFPSKQDKWEEELMLLSKETRRVLLSVPDGAEIMMDTPPLTPTRLHTINHTLEIFHRANFPEEKIFTAVNVLNNYITSYVLDEQKQTKMVQQMGAAVIREKFSQAISSIPRSDAPYLHLHLSNEKEKLNDEALFIEGIQIIINGLKMEKDYENR